MPHLALAAALLTTILFSSLSVAVSHGNGATSVAPVPAAHARR